MGVLWEGRVNVMGRFGERTADACYSPRRPPCSEVDNQKGSFFEINNKGVKKRMNEDWKGKLKVFVTYAS